MIARTILTARLDEVREALRRARLYRHMAWALAIGVLVRAIFLIGAWTAHPLPASWDRWSWLLIATVCLLAYLRGRSSIWSDRDIARMIEQKHPVLDSLLITAIEHQADARESTGYLHERLIDHALARSATQNWPVTVADAPYRRALTALVITSLTFVVTHLALRIHQTTSVVQTPSAVPKLPTPSTPTFTATLTPGDSEIERNARVIIEARFDGAVPADATLIMSDLDGKEIDRQPMRLTVDGQVFGGLIAKVERDVKYHVEFAGQKSTQHTLSVFDYPALVRSDVTVTPPEYTKLPTKETKNTRKVTALEGSKIIWKIQVNKPLLSEKISPFSPHLTAAELFGEDKSVIPLTPSASDPTQLEGVIQAEKSQKYRLHLVDEAERANQNPPWFTVTVQSNQLAKIEVVFPKRDLQVSTIQELPVEAKVSDDLSVLKSGVVFSINGNSKEITFSHPPTAPQKKQDVQAQLALEAEKTEPRQLVSYYFWAEDTGPQGELRRGMSDMFFADIRHFEDIFREGEPPPPEPGQKPQSDGLIDLQKQVVNATWRIIRDTNAGRSAESAAADAGVVHQSQGIVLEKTKEAMEKVQDAEVRQFLTEAWKSMKDALGPLEQASTEKKRSPLNQALTYEQSALEWLHRAQSREHQVARQNQPMASAAQKSNQNQIMDLELKQQEQRYEEEKTAAEEQSAEQQENLQVLNRLKELARRQEALAEKIKELQNQLANAKTEQEKQELENQLKRLQAEQEQLLRDLDDLKERMEKPENAQQMAEAREQLDQTRENVNEAAEQLRQQELTAAANAATRAQRELEQMQEDFRQKTSKQFSQEMKQLKAQATQAAETQKKIDQSLEEQKKDSADAAENLAKSLSNAAQSRQIDQQKENLEKMLQNMRQLSEQAEQSEPLLHQKLYDAVRQAQTSGLEENLQEAQDQLRYGTTAEAREANRKASNAVEELKKGVEKAAESVLGSESEALRAAKTELEKLIQEAEAQNGEAKGDKPGDKEGQTAEAKSEGQSAKGDKPGGKEGQTAEAKGEGQSAKGDKPGDKEGQTTEAKGEGKGDAKGQGQTASNPSQNPSDSSEPFNSSDQTSPQSQQPGQTPGKGQSATQTASNNPQNNAPQNSSRNPNFRDSDHDRTRPPIQGGALSESLFFDDQTEAPDNRVFTGDGYDRWSDRLRNVEELLNSPELRNEAAKILDHARELRINTRRSNQAPQVSVINQRITAPLVELRDRVLEELAKKDAGQNLAPVDRDPVPPQFRDLVKRYYQQLGSGK